MSFSVDEPLLVKCLRRANPKSNEILIKKYEHKPYSITPGSNYTSEIYSVFVEFECDGKTQEEYMVFKVPYVHRLYNQMQKAGVYEKENYMYNTIVPKLTEISTLSMLPKHYYITESQVLVLEDLTKGGYFLKDQTQWDLEPSILLLNELAKFHGASVKLYQLHPSVLEPASTVTLFREDVVVAIKNRVYPYLLEILKAENICPRVLEKFAEYKEKIDYNSIYSINRAQDFRVLNHGNLKSNNLLLKNNPDGSDSLKIIDYQTYFWHSPIFDLLYFVILTVDCDVFEKHQDKLIDQYLATLNVSLSNLKCECTYSRGAYEVDLQSSKLYQIFTLLFSSVLVIRECIPGFLHGDPLNLPSHQEVESIRKDEVFEGRFLKWFRYFQTKGYFD